MKDICFPNKNEEDFIKIAERLNIKKLYLIYKYSKDINLIKKNIQELQKTTKINLIFGLLSKPDEISISKKYSGFIITESSEKDQYVIEKLRPSLIFNLETSYKRDKTHYRLSGLNQVLCNLARDNNVIIASSFSELLNSDKTKRAVFLGRVIQNIKFCKKYKVKFDLLSFAKHPFELRNTNDLESLKTILSR